MTFSRMLDGEDGEIMNRREFLKSAGVKIGGKLCRRAFGKGCKRSSSTRRRIPLFTTGSGSRKLPRPANRGKWWYHPRRVGPLRHAQLL